MEVLEDELAHGRRQSANDQYSSRLLLGKVVADGRHRTIGVR
jgi:hypothetical protein